MSMLTMKQWHLPRTGATPIQFTGDQLASVRLSDKDEVRQYSVVIYENEEFIAWNVLFETTWRGEGNYAWSGVVRDDIQLGLALRSFNPIPARAGFPPGEKYAAKQAQFVKEYRTLYLRAIEQAMLEADIAIEIPYDGDTESIQWHSIATKPDPGVTCVLKFSSGAMVLGVAQESVRAQGQLSWNIGSTLAYDTPEIVAWGYLD